MSPKGSINGLFFPLLGEGYKSGVETGRRLTGGAAEGPPLPGPGIADPAVEAAIAARKELRGEIFRLREEERRLLGGLLLGDVVVAGLAALVALGVLVSISKSLQGQGGTSGDRGRGRLRGR